MDKSEQQFWGSQAIQAKTSMGSWNHPCALGWYSAGCEHGGFNMV